MPTHYPASLNDGKHVFVFGSNLAGRHGKGAALEAVRHWGAVTGAGWGPWGMSYALPTKDRQLQALELCQIKRHVDWFLEHARSHPELTFLITAIGTGLAGYSASQIAPMFRGAPANCRLPEEWREWLD